MNIKDKQISKFLSYILRHHPQSIGLNLDSQGWADIDELMTKAKKSGKFLKLDDIRRVVADNDKQRFHLDEETMRIRANQGHSLRVDLDLKSTTPKDILFHGTVMASISSIKKDGLKKMNRQHVHLSPDEKTATKVGARRGKPIILKVRALEMHEAGYEFYLSKNGVWLTDNVPAIFIDFP